MASKIAENLFNINNIKSGKKVFQVCPKFQEMMIVNGETHAAVRGSPCYLQLPTIQLPERLDKAVSKYLRDNVIQRPSDLRSQAKDLKNILWTRPLIIEKNLIEYMEKQVKRNHSPETISSIKDTNDHYENSEEENMDNFVEANSKVIKKMYQKSVEDSIRNQVEEMATAIRYSQNLSNLYLVARLAPNFAACCKVFYEMRKRLPKFNPANLYDFGSGVGSAVWAANSVWPIGTIKQHFLVDASTTMLSISEYLLKDGAVKQHLTALPGITHRSYLSSTVEVLFDVVISCHSLLDIAGGYLTRREILTNLWQKTGKFLILIEQGNNFGFKAILEARDWLMSSTENDENPARIFAPCPHSMNCPKADSVCSFPVKFEELRLTEQIGQRKQEHFSYIVLYKGDISEYQTEYETILNRYPRIISYKSSKNVQDLCQIDGRANRYFMELHDRPLKRFLRRCQSGDFMPVIPLNKLEKISE